MVELFIFITNADVHHSKFHFLEGHIVKMAGIISG
jgi:hypothetical protein